MDRGSSSRPSLLCRAGPPNQLPLLKSSPLPAPKFSHEIRCLALPFPNLQPRRARLRRARGGAARLSRARAEHLRHALRLHHPRRHRGRARRAQWHRRRRALQQSHRPRRGRRRQPLRGGGKPQRHPQGHAGRRGDDVRRRHGHRRLGQRPGGHRPVLRPDRRGFRQHWQPLRRRPRQPHHPQNHPRRRGVHPSRRRGQLWLRRWPRHPRALPVSRPHRRGSQRHDLRQRSRQPRDPKDHARGRGDDPRRRRHRQLRLRRRHRRRGAVCHAARRRRGCRRQRLRRRSHQRIDPQDHAGRSRDHVCRARWHPGHCRRHRQRGALPRPDGAHGGCQRQPVRRRCRGPHDSPHHAGRRSHDRGRIPAGARQHRWHRQRGAFQQCLWRGV
jgi:hypothetical protein